MGPPRPQLATLSGLHLKVSHTWVVASLSLSSPTVVRHRPCPLPSATTVPPRVTSLTLNPAVRPIASLSLSSPSVRLSLPLAAGHHCPSPPAHSSPGVTGVFRCVAAA